MFSGLSLNPARWFWHQTSHLWNSLPKERTTYIILPTRDERNRGGVSLLTSRNCSTKVKLIRLRSKRAYSCTCKPKMKHRRIEVSVFSMGKVLLTWQVSLRIVHWPLLPWAAADYRVGCSGLALPWEQEENDPRHRCAKVVFLQRKLTGPCLHLHFDPINHQKRADYGNVEELGDSGQTELILNKEERHISFRKLPDM